MTTIPECVQGLDRERLAWLPEAVDTEWPETQFALKCTHKKGEEHTALHLTWLDGPSPARLALVTASRDEVGTASASPMGNGEWLLKVGKVRIEVDPEIHPKRAAVALVRSMSEVADLDEIVNWVLLDFKERSRAMAREYEKALILEKAPSETEARAAELVLFAAGIKDDKPIPARNLVTTLSQAVRHLGRVEIQSFGELLKQI